jgi:chromosomal replication initiator protein
MPLLEERLCSRFQWGLTVDIQPPELETRLAILQAKAKQRGQDIASDVLDFIAQRIEQNVRELEGSLNRVVAYAKLLRALVTPELAAKALESIATKPSLGTAITASEIIETVADIFQIAPAELKGRKRDKETALSRQVAMYLIKEETHSSLAKIGHELGNRNPATVSHACDKIASEIDASPYLMHKISDIRARIHPQPKHRKKR